MLALVLAFATSSPGSDVRHPTTEETRAEFREVCDRITSGENPYFGSSVVAALESQLANEPVTLSPMQRVALRGQLAENLLRFDRDQEAIRRLDEAAKIASEAGLPIEIRARIEFYQGLAWMQRAENQNCVAQHGPYSCILPIHEDAIHTTPAAARRAREIFAEHFEKHPAEVQARWLMNVMAMVTGDYPESIPESLRVSDFQLARDEAFSTFRNVAPLLGVHAVDLAGGAVIDDFDGDGHLDLVTSTWDPCGSMKAFRNDGKGGFIDVTTEWGLNGQLGGLNIVHADYDNDGRLDLIVLRGGWLGNDGRVRNSLLRNEIGRDGGSFVDVTAFAGLGYPAHPTQTAAWADMDSDGDLDLYVGNESGSSQVYSWNLIQNPGTAFPSQLFQNNGDGTFTDIARAAGVTNGRYTKGVAWGDFDNDGDPDLYVSNIGPNRLFRNDGMREDGLTRFTDVAPRLGVTGPEESSFATWFFDYDNDGDLDIWVNDYGATVRRVSASYLGLTEPGERGHPIVYRNDSPEKSFTDVSTELGLSRPVLPMGANFGDMDNDGYPDVLLGTGVPDLEALMPDVAYRNERGSRFSEVTFAGGFGHLQKGHGVAFGDFDGDGDQDILHQMGGAYPSDAFANALYENPGKGNRWITLRLCGVRANRFGVGARIEVRIREGETSRSIHTLVGSGGSFGGSSMQQEIGLGKADEILGVAIRWPGSGTVQDLGSLEMDRVHDVAEESVE